MRCGKARQLILLRRPGELDDATSRELHAHVKTCPRCAAEQEAMNAAAAKIDALRRAEPRLEDAAALTQAVMRQVDAERLAGVRRRPAFETGGLMSYRLRAVCSAAVFLIVGAFFLQSYVDARHLESLEARLGQGPQSPDAAQNLSASDLRTVASAAGRMEVLNPRQAAAVASEMGAAFAVIRTTSLGTTPEMERLRAKYPRLWTLTLERGLDAQTRKILATDGKAFLKEVQDLIDLGGQ